ncbi:hypothetical protein HG531_004408 [Fusarium graminearum]|nr:hypothetical protein HG531_004408 [Fusarium graminearum]
MIHLESQLSPLFTHLAPCLLKNAYHLCLVKVRLALKIIELVIKEDQTCRILENLGLLVCLEILLANQGSYAGPGLFRDRWLNLRRSQKLCNLRGGLGLELCSPS